MLGLNRIKKVVKACIRGHNKFFQVIDFYFYSLVLLISRLFVAKIFFVSGSDKFNNIDNAIFLFEYEYDLPGVSPVLAAYLTTFSELICSTMIVVGFFSRLATLPLITIAVAVEFLVVENVQHLYWILLLSLIFVSGSGYFSLDRYLKIK